MINIKNLKKSFGQNEVIKNLNLEVKKGEILFIVGKSGTGKSVLLKHIMGLIKPDAGEILIDDDDMTTLEGTALLERLKNITMIFQMGALFDSMTIGENVAFYPNNHKLIGGEKVDAEQIRQATEDALAMVDLEGVIDKHPSELSGGMRKRVAIARGFIAKPDYLLYDEPTTGLDCTTAQIIAKQIVTVHKKIGATTMVVSHDMITTLYCADRIALIEDGEIVLCDTPHNFMKSDNEQVKLFNEIIGHDLSLIGNDL